MGHLLDQIDSVYFLLRPGWETELRGNRWHFAVRWAKVKPVVLVNPVLKGGPPRSVPEPRIPNCRILRIQSLDEAKQLAKAQIQLGQVLTDMAQHQFAHPLLWCYNPSLVNLYARLRAAARLYHATEAYFDTATFPPIFYERLRAVVAISDLTVAVSDGVAAGLRARVPSAEVETIANGCDYVHYSGGKPDEDLRAKGGSFSRVAIYAGNINTRLDFALLNRLATANPKVLFGLYGPVGRLEQNDMDTWQRTASLANVLAPGAVAPDRLRDLYAAADVGIIPYRQDPVLVENGLPLKALEMCATGLPVVSTLMKPLVGMTRGLVVTSTADEFLAAFASTSRATLSANQVADMIAVSSANDYDKKFQQVVAVLGQRTIGSQPTTRVDQMAEALGPEWFAAEVRFAHWLALPMASHVLGWLIVAVASLVPVPLRRRLPWTRLHNAGRDLLGS